MIPTDCVKVEAMPEPYFELDISVLSISVQSDNSGIIKLNSVKSATHVPSLALIYEGDTDMLLVLKQVKQQVEELYLADSGMKGEILNIPEALFEDHGSLYIELETSAEAENMFKFAAGRDFVYRGHKVEFNLVWDDLSVTEDKIKSTMILTDCVKVEAMPEPYFELNLVESATHVPPLALIYEGDTDMLLVLKQVEQEVKELSVPPSSRVLLTGLHPPFVQETLYAFIDQLETSAEAENIFKFAAGRDFVYRGQKATFNPVWDDLNVTENEIDPAMMQADCVRVEAIPEHSIEDAMREAAPNKFELSAEVLVTGDFTSHFSKVDLLNQLSAQLEGSGIVLNTILLNSSNLITTENSLILQVVPVAYFLMTAKSEESYMHVLQRLRELGLTVRMFTASRLQGARVGRKAAPRRHRGKQP
ncbi:Acetyl-coenzyme A carboxylase carboxyl transferase subunit beta 1 [Frankliniella fusca]|uniref:Acetyl-coenzyme A carboxylase carboxyl transferase subunit beta 1 n=1 Tax=Frankliniella fusca TaxID=407009 RepID=A0AAE1GUN1_9NEOP|nr:Acetyl-coenzyme A carboxylase carboxyl transferase subunit beta 1 [Frankliniella fusca]